MSGYDGFVLNISPVGMLLIKVTGLLVIACLLDLALLRRNPRWRVFLWRGSIVGIIALPLGLLFDPPVVFTLSGPPRAQETLALDGDDVEHWLIQSRLLRAPHTLVANTDNSSTTPANTGAQDVVDDLKQRYPDAPLDVGPAGTLGGTASESGPPTGGYRTIAGLALTACWIGGAALLLLRMSATMWRIRRDTAQGLNVPEALIEHSTSVAKALGCGRAAELRVTPGSGSPYLAGHFRPVIVLPERMVRERDDTELSAVLAHEFSHLKSCDIIWLQLGRALSFLLWFHPLAWRMQVTHAAACEGVSDAVAADYIGDRAAYSRILARTALAASGTPCATGLSMVCGGQVLRRIRNLERGIPANVPARRRILASAAVGVLVIGSALVSGVSPLLDKDRLSDTEHWNASLCVQIPCKWTKRILAVFPALENETDG